MIYLINGERSLVEKQISDIIKKDKIDPMNITKYDLVLTPLGDVIMDINTISLFDDKKLVIAYNLDQVEDLTVLDSYLKNKNDNTLILTATKVDERLKVIKRIKEKECFIDAVNIDLFSYIKDSLKDYKINYTSIILLKDYCQNNYYRLTEELEKLKMYKLDEKEITDDDIKFLCKKPLINNVFELTNAINKRDYKKMFATYKDLSLSGEDDLKIISLLDSNFRTLYKVKYLLLEKSDQEIIKFLKLNPYYFKNLKGDSLNFTKKELSSYLQVLGDIDIKIKSGKLDKKDAVSLFLASI